MTKEELLTKQDLIEFLHENLTVEIEREFGFYSRDSYGVTIKLDGKTISSSSTPIYESKE